MTAPWPWGGRGRHDLDLAGHRVLRRRADEEKLAWVAKLGMRFLRALVRLVEHQDAEEFRQQHHVDVAAAFQHGLRTGKACAAHQQCGHKAKGLPRFHGVLLR
jgi:hypothetical protein